MLVETTRAHMDEKYEWAKAANTIIQSEGAYYRAYGDPRPGSETDILKLKQAFWSLLQAYQQVRFYHGAWLAQTNRRNQGNKYMDEWKQKFLTPAETQTWDLLNKLRTEDTHNQPIIPDITVSMNAAAGSFSASYAPHSSGGGGTGQQYQGVYGHKQVQVHLPEGKYDLLPLTHESINLMRRFIDTFDQIS